MNLKEALGYFAGADYLKEHLDFQQELLVENTGSNDPHLPFDGDLKTAGRVYIDRLRMMFEYPILIGTRIAGIDFAINKFREAINADRANLS